MRNKVHIEIRKAKSSCHKNLLKGNSTNQSQFWKTIKSIYPTKSSAGSSIHSFDLLGEKITDTGNMANGSCNFSLQSSRRYGKKPFLCATTWTPPRPVRKRTDKRFSFQPGSQVEVERYLKLINRNKSTSIDNLPPCLLKDAAHTISAPLTHLRNLSLQTALFPYDWKLAKIVPIHKSGSHSNFDNYRPI